MRIQLVISCEHGVNTIPEAYQAYFKGHQDLLNSHKGIDFGAEFLAKKLAEALHCPLFMATASRLLIDCNRSLHMPDCFSEISMHFSASEKNQIIQTFYTPYRLQVTDYIKKQIAKGKQVWHISMHSFTPVLNHIVRTTELALLYDCKRQTEKYIVLAWQKLMKKEAKGWRIRLNYPYKGTADGLTTSLRKLFKDEDYAGIEVECNQALTQDEMYLMRIEKLLETSLSGTIRAAK